MRIADIHESDDTLRAVASTAERAASTVILEAEIDDDDDDDLQDDLGGQRNNDSPLDNDGGDLHSQITNEDRIDLATQNLLMLEMWLENQANWKGEQKLEWERMAAKRERIAANRDYGAADRAEHPEWSIAGPRPNIHKRVDPVKYCGGAKELDRYRDLLHLKLYSHGHLFPRGGPDHVKYAISLLDAWSNHQNPALRQMVMTDPSESAGDLSVGSDPCRQDFDLVSHQMARVYGENDRRRVAVITLMQEYIQHPQESVRAYANSVIAN